MKKTLILRRCALALLFALAAWSVPGHAWAEGCPLPGSEIDTDRPDTTNSSDVVPTASLQIENGVNAAVWRDGTHFDGTTTRFRLGVSDCYELLMDLPDYAAAPKAAGVRGFTGIAPAGKVQLENLPPGLEVAVVAGVGLPTGAASNGGQATKPYLQVPWSQELSEDWGVHGMLTQTWAPGQASDQLFEGTLSLERELGEQADVFLEYVGDYPSHDIASQVLDFGGSWRFTPLQQVDFHAGFGFTRNAPRLFIGVGYSFRLDKLF